jgi:hypothetical protein
MSSSTSSNSAPSSAITSLNQLRIGGQPATDQQVSFACSNVGNQVFNGGFELVDSNGDALGWNFTTDDTMAMFFVDAEDPTQHTPGGSLDGQVVSESNTASGRLYQSLTLCPNTTYSFEAWTRQQDYLSECIATFQINMTAIGEVMPRTSWTNAMFDPMNYTVGPGQQDGAVDLSIFVRCLGDRTSDVDRVIELDDISLVELMS